MKTILTLLLVLITLNLSAQEVQIIVDTCTIKGTLELPQTDQPVTAVLIIAGSGPTDRNGNNRLAGENNAYKMLADLLLQNGIASLRYDKRGIGESCEVNEAGLTFETYINDAVEWINFLKNDERISNVIIIGHSEGSLIGMAAAQKTDVSKFISLCGAGRPIDQILEEQVITNGKLPEPYIEPFKSSLDSLKQGHLVNKVDPAFMALFRPSVQPYLISWLKYNPVEEISKLNIPVLVVGGTTDIQVAVKDAELLAAANPDAGLAIIENMNHILKNVPSTDRAENFKSYSNPDLPLSDNLCEVLLKFIKE